MLDRVADPGLTALTRIASYVTGADVAAIDILDDSQQHRIAATDAQLGAYPRDDSMSRVAVDSGRRIVCANAAVEPLFAYSSLVSGRNPVRFYAAAPLRTFDGAVVGSLSVSDATVLHISNRQIDLLDDLADQAVSHIELTRIAVDLGHVASHDPLTGAVSRLVLGDRLAQAFARRLRHGGETFVALVEIADLETINDLHGRDAGDEVLVALADRLRRILRGADTVARVGGGTFMVLAELDRDAAIEEELMRRIESAVSEPIVYAGVHRPLGVRVGCLMAETGEDLRSLMRRAEEATYSREAMKTTA